MSGLSEVFCILIGAYGIRSLIEWIKLRRAGTLIESRMLCPNGKKTSDCLYAGAYYRFIMPWFIVFALASIALGILGIIELLMVNLNLRTLNIICFVGFVLATAAFGGRLSKGFRQYW